MPSLNGHRLRVNSHPPEFTSRPWFPLMVRVAATATITPPTIVAAINSQLGFSAPIEIEFRLRSVRFWGDFPSIASTPGIGETRLIVYDPIYHVTNLSRALTVLTGFPDQVNRVALGFKYPNTQSNYVIEGVSVYNLFTTANAGSTGVLYVELLWRGNTVP